MTQGRYRHDPARLGVSVLPDQFLAVFDFIAGVTPADVAVCQYLLFHQIRPRHVVINLGSHSLEKLTISDLRVITANAVDNQDYRRGGYSILVQENPRDEIYVKFYEALLEASHKWDMITEHYASRREALQRVARLFSLQTPLALEPYDGMMVMSK